jgi:ribosomal protein S18 acetylase RimI-like enzyme
VIVPAKIEEIPEIILMTQACARKMITQNIYQWNSHYPSPDAFTLDIARGELYVLKAHHQIIGCVVCSFVMDQEYLPIQWLTPSKNNLYIHRLAVHPEHQSQGHARALMDFSEAFAKAHSCPSVRLDTFSKNERNQRFYTARGYQRLGNIYFPKQSEHPFYCYELVLEHKDGPNNQGH